MPFVRCGRHSLLPPLKTGDLAGNKNLLLGAFLRSQRTWRANIIVAFPARNGTQDGVDCEDLRFGMRSMTPVWRAGNTTGLHSSFIPRTHVTPALGTARIPAPRIKARNDINNMHATIRFHHWREVDHAAATAITITAGNGRAPFGTCGFDRMTPARKRDTLGSPLSGAMPRIGRMKSMARTAAGTHVRPRCCRATADKKSKANPLLRIILGVGCLRPRRLARATRNPLYCRSHDSM